MDKAQILENISKLLLESKTEDARAIIQNEYPHKHIELEKRSYTLKEKMEQFLRDGFIDRYTGKRLVYFALRMYRIFGLSKIYRICVANISRLL